MPEPHTPQKVRRDYDNYIHRLNTTWNLQLPLLHGRVAEAAETEDAIARRCASRIRYMCFRPKVDLDGIIEGFEDYAKHVHSDWVWKPKQTAGTLPSVPKSRSVLHGDALAKAQNITPAERQGLLGYLDKVLDDEYRLSLDCPFYERSRARSTEATAVSAHQYATANPAKSSFATGHRASRDAMARSRSESGALVVSRKHATECSAAIKCRGSRKRASSPGTSKVWGLLLILQG